MCRASRMRLMKKNVNVEATAMIGKIEKYDERIN